MFSAHPFLLREDVARAFAHHRPAAMIYKTPKSRRNKEKVDVVRRQPMFSLKIIRLDMSEAAPFRSSSRYRRSNSAIWREGIRCM